jgi:hypothetical protein
LSYNGGELLDVLCARDAYALDSGGGGIRADHAFLLQTTVNKAYILRPAFQYETTENAIVCLNKEEIMM